MSQRLPAEMEDAMLFLREAAEHLAEQAAPRPPGDSPQMELGYQVEEVNPDAVRGNFDVSRLEQRNPRLVGAITFMLGLHFMPWDVIAKACGTSFETVAAVADTRKESIREFKGRMAGRLARLMEAMTPALLRKVQMGQVSFLDLKLLHDVWAPLAGEATSIVENRQGLPALDGLMQAMREAVTVRDVGAPSQMGSEAGEISAMGAGAPGLGAGSAGALGDESTRLGVLSPVRDAEIVELGVERPTRDAECTDGKSQSLDTES
jgi:hypothetical protein